LGNDVRIISLRTRTLELEIIIRWGDRIRIRLLELTRFLASMRSNCDLSPAILACLTLKFRVSTEWKLVLSSYSHGGPSIRIPAVISEFFVCCLLRHATLKIDTMDTMILWKKKLCILLKINFIKEILLQSYHVSVLSVLMFCHIFSVDIAFLY